MVLEIETRAHIGLKAINEDFDFDFEQWEAHEVF